MGVSPARMSVHLTCMPGACRDEKRAVEPLELQMAVDPNVGARNETGIWTQTPSPALLTSLCDGARPRGFAKACH